MLLLPLFILAEYQVAEDYGRGADYSIRRRCQRTIESIPLFPQAETNQSHQCPQDKGENQDRHVKKRILIFVHKKVDEVGCEPSEREKDQNFLSQAYGELLVQVNHGD